MHRRWGTLVALSFRLFDIAADGREHSTPGSQTGAGCLGASDLAAAVRTAAANATGQRERRRQDTAHRQLAE